MAISRSTAARLCTRAEMEIVDASAAARVRDLTPGRLRQKIGIARRLRDKYRDLAKRQRLEARGKRSPQRTQPARGSANTERKAQLFQETLDRFERRLSAIGGAAKTDAKKAGAKKAGAKKAGAKKAGAKKAGAKKAGAKKAGAKKAGAKKAGAKKAGAKKAGAKKAGAKKAGAKKAGAKKAGAKKAGAKKAGARKGAGRAGPAGGAARPAEPATAGAAAPRGGRRRPAAEDGALVGRSRTVQSHTRASNRRRQVRRDRRQEQ